MMGAPPIQHRRASPPECNVWPTVDRAGWSSALALSIARPHLPCLLLMGNSNLPPSFVNEFVKFVEDETIVRSNLKSVSDVYSWIEEYGRTSDTKWNLRSSRPSGTRLVC
ncbi:hypothetical protein AVEN_116258-1, partial [Araneus ventricosus]